MTRRFALIYRKNIFVLLLMLIMTALWAMSCSASTPVVTIAVAETATPIEVAALATIPTTVVSAVQPLNSPVNAAGVAAGSLVKSADNPGVFWLTSSGDRQHIYDWQTYLDFGFKPEDILTVPVADLNAIPLTGELTRLVYDADGHYYWAAAGWLWEIADWQAYITGPAYQGAPATPIDPLLLERLPRKDTIPAYVVLRDGDDFYLNSPERLYHLADATIYHLFGYGDSHLINVPSGVLNQTHRDAPKLTQFLQEAGQPFGQTPLYQMIGGRRQVITQDQLVSQGYSQQDVTAVSAAFLQTFPSATSLRVGQTDVNLRSGPGTAYEIVGQADSGSELAPIGRTQAGSWFRVLYQGQPAWVSASVVRFDGDIYLLPEAEGTVVEAITPDPTPTPPTIPGTNQPAIACDEVPIRGFGKVWADHPEIQPTLGCPYTFEGGEQGVEAAIQRFEHGWMIWVAQDQVYYGDPVYVLFEDNGAFQRFGDLGPADPTKMGDTPDGFYPVGDQFSKVYWEGTGAQVKERLGHAIAPASDSPGAFQNFWNGRMLWLGEIDRIFVIYNYAYYDQTSETTYWVKNWSGYEDKF